MEEKKVEETKDEAPLEEQPEEKKESIVVKSPAKPSKVTVNVKLVRRLDGETGLFVNEDDPGDFYLVELAVLEPGSRNAVVAQTTRKPYDWSNLLNKLLPSRADMIKDACAHLLKSGMVELDDLNDNALRSKAFREMLNYTIPKNPDE